MEVINQFLAEKGIYTLTVVLLFLGMFGMAVCGNYMKKLICMNMMQVAAIFFFLCLGEKDGGTIPVVTGANPVAEDYVNPLPHAQMLTAIVVSLGTSGVGLALLMRIKEKFGSIEEEDILEAEKGERNDG